VSRVHGLKRGQHQAEGVFLLQHLQVAARWRRICAPISKSQHPGSTLAPEPAATYHCVRRASTAYPACKVGSYRCECI
jgi:hypothetical protein